MPKFKYQARNSLGKVTEGVIEADSEAAVASALRQKRLEVVSVSGVSGLSALWTALNKKRKSKDTNSVG